MANLKARCRVGGQLEETLFLENHEKPPGKQFQGGLNVYGVKGSPASSAIPSMHRQGMDSALPYPKA